MIPHHWKRAAADNGSADPNADVRPGRSASTVLGTIRGLMASGAASRDDAIGELVATLNGSTTNVYSVSSNEGLIDIATGINGVPAAITAPFLLRLSFDTTLAGSAANAPHLKVDGFDCGPILRRNGAALADGDLIAGTPVVVLGDMAASTDTKVTRVRVLDLLRSDIAALKVAPGLVETLSFTPLVVLQDMPAVGVAYASQVISISGASYAKLTSRVAVKNAQSAPCGVISQINCSDGSNSLYAGVVVSNGIQSIMPTEWTRYDLDRTKTYIFTQICQKSSPVGPIQVLDAYLRAEHDGN